MLANLANDPLFIVICSAGGLLIGVYGIWLTIKFQRLNNKIPQYTRRDVALVRAESIKVEELSHKFEGYGAPINNLTLTKLLFWNAGNVPIKADDIAPAAPIRLHARNEAVILSVALTRATNDAARFELVFKRTDRKTVAFSFDFLQRGDAFLVTVLHTGKDDADLELEGQVIGAGPFALIPYHQFVSTTRRERTNFSMYVDAAAAGWGRSPRRFLYAVLLTCFALFTFFFSAVKIYCFFHDKPLKDALGTTFIECTLFVLPAYFFARVSYRIFYSLPPAFFDVFESDCRS